MSNYKAGVASIIFATFFLYLYIFVYERPSLDKVKSQTISYQNCYLIETRKTTDMVLEAENKRYWMKLSLWKGKYETDYILKKLKNNKSCVIWFLPKNPTIIQGLAVDSIYIDPSVGIDSEKSNQRFLLLLIIAFYAMGFYVILRKRRTSFEEKYFK
jgi:hypothetical protein